MRTFVMGFVLCAGVSCTTAFAQASAGSAPQAGQQKQVQAVGVSAVMKKSLDSKRSKVGDAVEAQTQQSVKLPDGKELPKGSTLVGHVTQATEYDKKTMGKDGAGSVSFVIDNAKLKDGTTVPVRAVVQQIAPSQMQLQAEGSNNASSSDMPMASAPTGGGAAPSGGSDASGGGSASTPAPPVSAPAMPTSSASDTTQAAASAGGPGSSVPGVALSASNDGSTSGTLSAKGKNVDVYGGATVLVAVVPR